jgi:hypothetical protein
MKDSETIRQLRMLIKVQQEEIYRRIQFMDLYRNIAEKITKKSIEMENEIAALRLNQKQKPGRKKNG